jgi:MFS transporter, SP family, arabinose:H+ symporter
MDTLAGTNRSGGGLYLGGISFVASLGGLLFGFDTAVISGTFGFVEAQYALSKLELGWFASSALAGCVVGAACAGSLSDRFGRKPMLLLAAFFYFISALYSTIPPSFTILIPARIIGGVGVGMASVLAPMYITEFAPPRIRGRLVAAYQLSIVIGILLAYASNWFLLGFSQSQPAPFAPDSILHLVLVAEVWRGMFGAEMIPAVLFLLLLFLVPESPRWLVSRHRVDRARAVLSRISGSEVAEHELADIHASLQREEGSWRELFSPAMRRALLVGVGLSFFGQLTGVNIVVYYGPTILSDAGLALGSALQYQVTLGVINLIFTCVAIWKIDSWGRRPLLVGGMALVTLALGLTAILLFVHASALAVVAVLCAYMACNAVSISGVIWVLTPEVFPNRLRGRGASLSTFTNWTINAASAFVFPWYVARLGMHTGFLTFAVICSVATFYFWKMVPETRGKSLEEIEQMWTEPG